MKIKITGTPEEIEKLLNAIGDSKEQLRILKRIERNTEPLTSNGEKHQEGETNDINKNS